MPKVREPVTTGTDLVAWMPRRVWLVTTMSAAATASRARRGRHSSANGHDSGPKQSVEETETFAQPPLGSSRG